MELCIHTSTGVYAEVDVKANDVILEAGSTTNIVQSAVLVITTPPINGSASVQNNGNISYLTNTCGPDSLTYAISYTFADGVTRSSYQKIRFNCINDATWVTVSEQCVNCLPELTERDDNPVSTTFGTIRNTISGNQAVCATDPNCTQPRWGTILDSCVGGFNNFYQQDMNPISATSFQTRLVATTDPCVEHHTNSDVVGATYFVDLNGDCQPNSVEKALVRTLNGLVVCSGDRHHTLQSNGALHTYFDATSFNPGLYIKYDLILPVPYTIACGANTDTTVAPLQSYGEADARLVIPIQIPYLSTCANLMVDIGTNFLRRCSTATYDVTYVNLGLDTAQNAYVEVLLDQYLTVVSATAPYTVVNGMLRFEIGDIASLQAGQIHIVTTLLCDSNQVAFGQVHCAEATIYPHNICENNAGMAVIDVQNIGEDATNVYFKIKNTSTNNMTAPTEYRVYEEHLMRSMGNVQLNAGAEQIVTVARTAGAAYRVEVDQVAGVLGFEILPSALGGDLDSTVLELPEDDNMLWHSTFCSSNRDSYDPNSKEAYTKGYGPNHYITPETELEYIIHFQNEGTADALEVNVVDEIDTDLDINSIQFGTSSHAYLAQVEGNKVKFRFNNINLTPKTTNEAASMGYVKYTIRQKANNLPGTVINGASAAIFFDFNSPIATNTTKHIIEERSAFVQVLSMQDLATNVHVGVYPNPASDYLNFQVKNTATNTVYELEVIDMVGRIVSTTTFDQNYTLSVNQLASGTYTYTMKQQGSPVARGKFIVTK